MLLMTLAMIYKLGRHGDRNIESASTQKDEAVIPLVTLQSSALPNPPFLVDWCEGENCEAVISKIVNCDSNLLQQADGKSRVVGKIAKGEQVKGRILFTKILKTGLNPHSENQKEIISYAGEGSWNTFFQGKWETTEESETEAEKKTWVYPQTEDWVLIETSAGVSGFVKRTQTVSKGSCPLGLVEDQY